jgi:hypothetical protein
MCSAGSDELAHTAGNRTLQIILKVVLGNWEEVIHAFDKC